MIIVFDFLTNCIKFIYRLWRPGKTSLFQCLPGDDCFRSLAKRLLWKKSFLKETGKVTPEATKAGVSKRKKVPKHHRIYNYTLYIYVIY